MSNTSSMISSTPSPLPIVAEPRVAEPRGEYRDRVEGDRWVDVLVNYPQKTNSEGKTDLPKEIIEEEVTDWPKETGEEETDWPKLYTYSVPQDINVNEGDIILIPFKTQVLGGIVVRELDSPPLGLDCIRNVIDVISASFFSPSYWKLLHKIAEYYFVPLIAVACTALPPGLLVKSQSRIRLVKKFRLSTIPIIWLLFQQYDCMAGILFLHQPLPNVLPKGFEIFCSTTAREIIELLLSQKEGNYSRIHINRKLKKNRNKINYEIKKLKQRGWIESYLELPDPVKPKRRKAITLISNPSNPELRKRQREILHMLKHKGGEMWLTDCIDHIKTTSETLQRLEEEGHIVIQDREELRLYEDFERGKDNSKILNARQMIALKNIQNLSGYGCFLLHGVTGSGKTEVYLQAIAPLLKQKKSALVLVPEIGLTPQLTDRFRARFGDRVQVYHSDLNKGERYDTWRNLPFQEAQVVIGTRSAIFSPLKNLGLIILDEEHDHSFKQQDRIPTYHARTVAQWRAELENCPLILGSATPALETWIASQTTHPLTPSQEEESQSGVTNKQPTTINPPPNPLPRGGEPESSNQPTTNNQQQIHYLSLPDRIHSRPFPPVEVVDMRKELKQGNRSMFSIALRDALKQLKPTGKKGILFIPRRGHSTFVSCRSCGYVIECPRCDVSLSYHHVREGAKQLLRCHYCNYSIPHPSHCPECDSPYLKFFGTGTQKVARAIAEEFPDLRVIRFDSDTTRAKNAHRTKLTEFAEGEADLLVGTQMLTKGLDIAEVTLVGILAADGLLHLADYRASERAFQTLTQVAGRAGRGDDPGRVILQTYTPDHPVVEAVCNHDYFVFARETLLERSQLNYPPYSRLILLRLSGLDAGEVESAANLVAQGCQTLLAPIQHELLGPAPANIMRIDRRYRWQILLKFSLDTKNLPDLAQLKKLCPSSVRLTIDVDPLSIS